MNPETVLHLAYGSRLCFEEEIKSIVDGVFGLHLNKLSFIFVLLKLRDKSK